MKCSEKIVIISVNGSLAFPMGSSDFFRVFGRTLKSSFVLVGLCVQEGGGAVGCGVPWPWPGVSGLLGFGLCSSENGRDSHRRGSQAWPHLVYRS